VSILYNAVQHSDKFLHKFLARTSDMSPHDAGIALEEDEEVEEAHVGAAEAGQSAVVAEVNAHFVALSHVDGSLYELDGRKAFPINHGPTSQV
jgi:ubiquitin carboxyl-terminal hydrolase L3